MIAQPDKNRKKIFKWIGVGILIVLCTCFAGVYLLKSGLTIERLSIGQVIVSNSSLVWNDKLELDLGRVAILQGEERTENFYFPKLVARSIKTEAFLSRFVSKITIESIKIGDRNVSIDLTQQQDQSYLLHLESETTKLDALVEIEAEGILVIITDLSDDRIGLKASGQVQFETKDVNLTGSVIADIENSFPVELNFAADDEKISFWGAEAGIITDIMPFVDLFGMPQNITKWFTDYLSASRYHLKSLKGEYVFGDPMSLFHSFEAEIMVEDVAYIFEPDLEPIYDDQPRAFFKNGVFNIRPHKPVFYGHDVGNSWVDINFNDFDNVILTAYIKARAIADQAILDLLSYYSIDLPFLQVEGETESDLQLVINLRTDEISGAGSFFIDEGIILYDGAEFNVKDTHFSLKDSEVLLEQLEVRYEDLFVAHVTGQILADKDVWDLDIDFDQLTFDLGESTLNLDVTDSAPDVGYHASPDGHFLEVSNSSWKLDSTALSLGGFRAPVNLDDLSAQIPPVSLAMPPGILTEISGSFSIKKEIADFNCQLLTYHVNNLKLEQPKTQFRVRYLDKLIIDTKERSQWSLTNVPITFYPSALVYADNVLTTAASSFSYGNFFESQFTGDFNTKTREGALYLSRIKLTHNNLDTDIDIEERTLVEITEKEGTFVIDFTEFDLRIMTDERGNWSAEFVDLSKIYRRSELLKTYKISSGNLSISSVNGNRPYNFTAAIPSPYPLLLQEGEVSDRLTITGKLTEEGLTAIVNENIHIDYFDDQLDISSQSVGYNIAAVKELMNDFFDSPEDHDEEGNDGVNLHLHAEDSYLYLSPQSKVLADTIELEYIDGELSMDLKHEEGQLQLQRIGGIYFVNGENLNDVFMGALIQGSYIQGGKLALAGMGTDDELSAVIEIQDTVLKDLKTLNNTMTLLNTLPALVTFSVPDYETKGLPVSSAIVGVKYSQGKTVFKSIDLKSSVLQAAGQGWIDTSNRQIDMDIQLTSQAGENIRKIPLVGYVVAGDSEDTSVTLKIEGALDNPEVSNSVLKEIATMPIDILFRTLNLPMYYIQKLNTSSGNGERKPIDEPFEGWQESDR
jgi:hypothetical protein